MLAVDEFGRIRRAHRNGMSIREIARTFRHWRAGSARFCLSRSRARSPVPRTLTTSAARTTEVFIRPDNWG